MICDLCKNNLWQDFYTLKKCKICGFVQADEHYYKSELSSIYGDNYYKEGDYYDYELEKAALSKNFENRLKIITKYIDKGKLLEVGSAYGYFLEKAKNYFDVEGVELTETAANDISNKLKLKVYNEPFENIKFSTEYDVLVSLDTIEHIKYPSSFFKKAFDILKPGGFIFLETGDIETLVPKFQKHKWRLIHPPEHLSYFSKKTLVNYLELYGFEILESRYVTFYRTASQTLYRLFNEKSKTLSEKFISKTNNIIFPTNTFDLIFISAYKKRV